MTDEEIMERLESAAESIAYNKVIRFHIARDIIKKMLEDVQTTIKKQNIQLAEQAAKIYAYETIIANSNFKAVLPKTKEGKK